MGFFSFLKKESPVALQQISRAPLAFRGTEGYAPDQYPAGTPFPPANNQYTYFNAIPGNQLPSFNTYMTVGTGQYSPIWQMPTSKELNNAHQNALSGIQALMFGQQQSGKYRQNQSANWQALYYNGGV